MIRRGVLLLAGLLLLAPVLPAQEGPAVFDNREWDFGAIREADGAVRHAFLVFNRSGRPLRIERAIPGCSCISAVLPREDVQPGASAAVEVVFTPAGAAGPVLRTVEIYAGGNRSLGLLTVSADVLPADRSIQERYPVVLAEGLYASRADVGFGYLERGRSVGKAFFVANATQQPMRLQAEGTAGSRFRVQAPDVLGPGEEARVEIWCDAPADPSFFATLRASLRLFPAGGQSLREMPLSGIVATQADDAPDAPSLRTGPLRLRRGLIRHDWHGTLEITNGGRSELVLHALELPAGVRCPAFRRGTRLAPGATLRLTVLRARKPSRQGRPSGPGAEPSRLTVFSNDPLRPAKEISIQLI